MPHSSGIPRNFFVSYNVRAALDENQMCTYTNGE